MCLLMRQVDRGYSSSNAELPGTSSLTLGFFPRSPGASLSWNAASPESKRLYRHYGPSEPPTSSQKHDLEVRLVLGVFKEGLSGKGSVCGRGCPR